MNENEIEKINKLDLNSIISKIQSSTYQIKYIENIGYVFIGEGYLILDDGNEPIHYFAKIFNSEEETRNEIINIYNEKFQIDNKEKGFIRKYMIDEKGMEYEVEEVIDFSFPRCPSCNERLIFLMPDSSHLYCNKCEKYYLNNNGDVGDETTSPYNERR